MRVFREWKRQGYEMVLEGLKKYSQTLDQDKRTMQQISASSSGGSSFKSNNAGKNIVFGNIWSPKKAAAVTTPSQNHQKQL